MIDYTKPWPCGECGQLVLSGEVHTFSDCKKKKTNKRIDPKPLKRKLFTHYLDTTKIGKREDGTKFERIGVYMEEDVLSAVKKALDVMETVKGISGQISKSPEVFSTAITTAQIILKDCFPIIKEEEMVREGDNV